MRSLYTTDDYKNTASKPIEQIEEKHFIVDVLQFNDGSLKEPHEIGFVVSKFRGYQEYSKVKDHPSTAKFGKYNNSLLDSMFGGW